MVEFIQTHFVTDFVFEAEKIAQDCNKFRKKVDELIKSIKSGTPITADLLMEFLRSKPKPPSNPQANYCVESFISAQSISEDNIKAYESFENFYHAHFLLEELLNKLFFRESPAIEKFIETFISMLPMHAKHREMIKRLETLSTLDLNTFFSRGGTSLLVSFEEYSAFYSPLKKII